MNQSDLTTHFRCGEIFHTSQQEFYIVCVLCFQRLPDFQSFTEHIVAKVCHSSSTTDEQSDKTVMDDEDPLSLQPSTDNTHDSLPIIRNNPIIIKDELIKKDTITMESAFNNKVVANKKSYHTKDIVSKSKYTLVSKPHTKAEERPRIVKKKIIWDPDDPKTQSQCEDFHKNLIASKTIKSNCHQEETKEFRLKLLDKKNTQNSVQKPSMKSVQKSTTTVPLNKKRKRIKQIIWDPDAPEYDPNLKKPSRINMEWLKKKAKKCN